MATVTVVIMVLIFSHRPVLESPFLKNVDGACLTHTVRQESSHSVGLGSSQVIPEQVATGLPPLGASSLVA